MRRYIKKKASGLDKPFVITSVCKADILSLQKQDKNGNVISKFKKSHITKLTESDMKQIASKLADAYCDNGFWIDLDIIVEYYLEQKKKFNNE